MAENCFACHGPDSAARQADLRLDLRDLAIEAGAIVPGRPRESTLVERIFAQDPSERMPPLDSHKKLTDSQQERLRDWIAGGAEYQPHWSLIAPQRPQRPAAGISDGVRNPIDVFVERERRRAGLEPAIEADRRSLARRASLDLVGLPPSPAEVESHLGDPAPDAYERYIDRLLASPHWGEHRGRHWLDYARYADTHGIHFDNYREMWSYRDWVIDALNRNLPFDRFTIEQLAGDLVPHRSLEQVIATGFNRCNITTNEGGVIDEEYLVLYTRDRTETVSQVWLGLTANCAVCHDHKFDPLTMRDFYSMGAFFNNSTQGARDGNIRDTPPIITVPRAEDRPRWEAIQEELAEAQREANARQAALRAPFEGWLAGARPGPVFASVPTSGLVVHAWLGEGSGQVVTVAVNGQLQPIRFEQPLDWQPGHVAPGGLKVRPGSVVELDQAGDFEKDQPFSCAAWVRLPNRPLTGAVVARLDDRGGARGWDLGVEGGRLAIHLVHRFPGDAIKVVAADRLDVGKWNHLAVTYDGSGKAAGVRLYVNGTLQEQRTIAADDLASSIRTQVPLKVGQRQQSSRLADALIGDVRIHDRVLAPDEVTRLVRGTRAAWLASKRAADRTPAEREELFGWWLPETDAPYRATETRGGQLQEEERAIRQRGTVTHVMQERDSEPMAYILFRGEYDHRRDAVGARTPVALPPMPADLPANRAGFAQWLFRPEHPLTARVTVNRYWQEVFGTGIVRTSGDFGTSGELPTHPELLDWLAVEFRESGWDVKRLFYLLVTSAAYRQSAITTPEKLARDPGNRLLSRGPRFRMDGESIREYVLAASGLLERRLGGPSVKPYQPPGVWEAVAMIGSNTRDYRSDVGADLYRRSMYTFWKRSAPPASMDIFNAPSRETCCVRRERTNTPLQALVTLNDPQFVEAARHLAERALLERGAEPQSRLDFAAQRLLARPLRSEEVSVVELSLATLLAHYADHPGDAERLLAVGEWKSDPRLDLPTLAAWTMLVNQLMNLDEVLSK